MSSRLSAHNERCSAMVGLFCFSMKVAFGIGRITLFIIFLGILYLPILVYLSGRAGLQLMFYYFFWYLLFKTIQRLSLMYRNALL